MENTYKLSLFENAIDSLEEALKKYEEALGGTDSAYKFVVLHFVHFIELIFKDHIYEIHPLLIYKHPFSEKLNENSQTITLHDAINFIRNENKEISESFKKDLDFIKKLRNQIEHYKFNMNTEEINSAIGRLMSSIIEFSASYSDENIFDPDNINDYIDPNLIDSFKKLAKGYKDRLDIAKELADEAVDRYRHQTIDGDNPEQIYDCPECGNSNFLIPNANSSTGYRCVYCSNEESRDIEVECAICSCLFEQDRMIEVDDIGYVCPKHPLNPEHREHDD